MQLPLGFVIELFLVSYHASPHSLLNYAASFTSLSPLINSHSAFLKFFLHTLRNILIFLCMRALKKKVMSNSATPWTVACQAPLSMGLSRQEYWSVLPCPPSEDLPHPGIEPVSPPLQADSLLLSHQGNPQ